MPCKLCGDTQRLGDAECPACVQVSALDALDESYRKAMRDLHVAYLKTIASKDRELQALRDEIARLRFLLSAFEEAHEETGKETSAAKDSASYWRSTAIDRGARLNTLARVCRDQQEILEEVAKAHTMEVN